MAGTLNDLVTDGRFYTVLCQNPKCRVQLGGMYIPSVGGIVYFTCQRCGTASGFKNGPYGIQPKILGHLKPDGKLAPAPCQIPAPATPATPHAVAPVVRRANGTK